jgi:hypothetical protein
MKKYTIILIAVLFEKAISQVGINFSSTFYSDDNIFKNQKKNYSNLSTSNASVFYNHFTENSQLKFSYGLNLNSYENYSAANNNTNSVDLAYALSNESEEQLLTLSLFYSGKTVKSDYKIYEENNITFFSGFDCTFNDVHCGTVRYKFNKINYTNFSDFSFIENVLGYTSAFTWQTKTSLFFDANLGYKIYSNDAYIFKNDSARSNLWTTKGNGFGKQKKVGETIFTSAQKMDNDNIQLLLSGKIAQSLFENLGAFFSYSFRFNVENNSRSIMISNTYFSDDNMFDDYYGYTGHELNFGLTYKLPLNITIKSSLEYYNKKYANEYPDINNKISERTDNKLLYNLRLYKSFDLFESFLDKLNIYLYYVYQNNNSNIKLFNYTNNIFAVGFNTSIIF